MNNAEFAKTDINFRKACELAREKFSGFKSKQNSPLDEIATRRQAGKFRRAIGIVYKTMLKHGKKRK